MSEWIDPEDYLPAYGVIVECLGNATICCDEDMLDEDIHRVTYGRTLSEWKEKDGKRYNEMWYHTWKCVDLEDHWIFNVRGWRHLDE